MMAPEKIEALRNVLAGDRSVVLGYLFGSQAKGVAGPMSDIDVAVLFEGPWDSRPAGEADLLLGRTISKALKTARIDVRSLNGASPFFRFQVVTHGKILYQRLAGERVDFEVRSRMIYFDHIPHYQLFLEAMGKRLGEGAYGRS